MDRLAPAVPPRRNKLLGAQRARRSAGLRALAGGAEAPRRTSARDPQRACAGARPGEELRRRGTASLRRRGAGRARRVAGDALGRLGLRSGGPASTRSADARQRRRDHVGLSGRGVARMGLRRFDDGSATRSRGVRRGGSGRPESGGSPIFPTSILSANATAFASRVGGPARAATSGWSAPCTGSMP